MSDGAFSLALILVVAIAAAVAQVHPTAGLHCLLWGLLGAAIAGWRVR